MHPHQNQFHFSFFKPTIHSATPASRHNNVAIKILRDYQSLKFKKLWITDQQ
jgi:hypothetical protein